MTEHELALLEQHGFKRIYTSTGLRGERLWWKRTGSSMDIIRQRDSMRKHQDLGDNHPYLPADCDITNRQWALELANDLLTAWQR